MTNYTLGGTFLRFRVDLKLNEIKHIFGMLYILSFSCFMNNVEKDSDFLVSWQRLCFKIYALSC